jgi:hypothetical protein
MQKSKNRLINLQEVEHIKVAARAFEAIAPNGIKAGIKLHGKKTLHQITY